MGIEADLASFKSRLFVAIENTMQTNVLDAAKTEIFDILNDYKWTKSRGPAIGSEGLRDREQMLGSTERINNQVVLEITDDADFQNGEPLNDGDTLDEVVTRGDKAYRMPEPRPFMQPAEEKMGEGTFEKALAAGLRERGF